MKPFLSAPLTQMDDWIYVWRVWRSGHELDRNHLEASSILADRRDAQLMYKAQFWDAMCYMCSDEPASEMVLVR